MAEQTSPSEHPLATEKLSHRIVEDYLAELNAIRASGAGVPEASYYPALSNLFNAVGGTLKPKVRCVVQLRNQGAGIPDAGLYTADQFERQEADTPKPGQLPARGAIEAKGTRVDIAALALSAQVKNYLGTYGIVVATNLRAFAIVGRGPNGGPEPLEMFSLADSEEDFWQQKAAHWRATAQLKGEQFIEFIKRACLHAAPLTNPKDVAWFLASYARDGLVRVERQKELPALQAVRTALEDALGMKFIAGKGEHFFRSTLVQTLFYGVFSAWVRWHKDNPGDGAKFDWQKAEWSLHVPFVRTLYEEVAKPSRLGPLGLVEVLHWAAGALNRVNRAEFFKRFEDEHAVQYFYEPFLEAYDPALRKALGVWYTPPEIVKYQVARVDRVLREELDLPDGLADPNVMVLDPCCGTGAYLVEVLHTIAATLRDKGGDALVASDLKAAAMNRVFGFEIMPAPFVVSHLQLSSLLQNQGAPLSQKGAERVGVYLTNALTGWEPPKGVKAQLTLYPELEEERDAAEQVKRDKKILVVLGNPPITPMPALARMRNRAWSSRTRPI
jgi:N-6 DNA Methylase